VQCIQTSLFLPISDALLPMHQPVFIDPPTGRSERILTVAYSPRPGVVGSLAVLRLVNSFLFGVSATNPFVYAAGCHHDGNGIACVRTGGAACYFHRSNRRAAVELVWTVSVTRYVFG